MISRNEAIHPDDPANQPVEEVSISLAKKPAQGFRSTVRVPCGLVRLYLSLAPFAGSTVASILASIKS
jgi:hypothetical protein